jgi:hypothetical protein
MRTVTAAVLEDPAYLVPAAAPAPTGIAWLRATVSRFCNGPLHARRRALAEELLAAIPPASLAVPYAGHPAGRLAIALGADASIVPDVQAVAAAYQTGDPAASPAVERLVTAFGGEHSERTAARIALLVQACDATATLATAARTRPVEAVLRDDPPVPATKRVTPAGELVRVSLEGAPFGAGPRACPGRAHALALVEGFVEGSR